MLGIEGVIEVSLLHGDKRFNGNWLEGPPTRYPPADASS